jgi:hypothetical protein
MTHVYSKPAVFCMRSQDQQNDACAQKFSRTTNAHTYLTESDMPTQVQQNDARIAHAQFILTTQISFRKSSYATLRFLTRNSPQGFLSYLRNSRNKLLLLSICLSCYQTITLAAPILSVSKPIRPHRGTRRPMQGHVCWITTALPFPKAVPYCNVHSFVH